MLHIALIISAAVLGPGEGKIVAQDDWRALTILEVGKGAPGGPHYLRVAAGDLDGDGRADEAYLKLVCADGALRHATYSIASPRDAASGMPTGKRQHGSVTIVKEWGPATPQLREIKTTYDVKKVEGARTDKAATWTAIALAESGGLCAATEAAAATIVKSKSNIPNN